MGEYRQATIRQLKDQQVRAATAQHLMEQTFRAEHLLEEISPEKEYPYDYVWYRITGYRPEHDSRLLLPGGDLRHDLHLFIEDLSESAGMAVESFEEPVLTVEDLAERFHISDKTVSRWRKMGLVGRRVRFGRRARLGFLQSSVERFVLSHEERVDRSSRFQLISDEEKEQIIRRARRLASRGATAKEISRRLARKMNRSLEAIRYTIRRFDEENPDQAVFASATGRLPGEMKEQIFLQFQRGTPAQDLARRYRRTRTTIYRIVNEIRAQRLLERPLDHIHHASFEDPANEAEILAPVPSAADASSPSAPKGLPPYLEEMYDVPLLTREQEQHLFRQMNYLKYKAIKLREKLVPARATTAELDQIEELLAAAQERKNEIVRANLRLVVSIAKRHVNPNRNFFELVSDGNVSLMRAADKFDYSRGNKFSTYASWAIIKNFARSIPDESHRQDRFRTGQDALFEVAPDNRTSPFQQEAEFRGVQRGVQKILGQLDQRERQIIVSRFGLQEEGSPQTLEQLGATLGVTKERVRQLEARALKKLRQLAEDEHLEVPSD